MQIRCAICEKAFQTNRSRQKTCSPECSHKYNNRRTRAHIKKMREKLVCRHGNGKTIVLKAPFKRPRTEFCEWCKRFTPHNYHHWDDENASEGVWLCNYCHQKAELLDRIIQAIDNNDESRLTFSYLTIKKNAKNEVELLKAKNHDY